MSTLSSITRVVELDGAMHRIGADRILPVTDLNALAGEKWLVTDFREAIARRMTVEGPAQYAEVLVRRKLQESGEFEEPVQILVHWKQRCGRNATDLLFTAVPARLASYYFEELRNRAELTLVIPIYAVLWDTLKRHARGNRPVAIVLRHDRFAEILVGTRKRVIFANRCVAFDSQPEQVAALWETVRTDLEGVEREIRVPIERVIRLDWLACEEPMPWSEAWQRRVEIPPSDSFRIDEQEVPLSLPTAVKRVAAWVGASPWLDKILSYTRRWAPAFNAVLAVVAVAMTIAWINYRAAIAGLRDASLGLDHQVRRLRLEQPPPTDVAAFGRLLDFIGSLENKGHRPSGARILGDLTYAGFDGLRLTRLAIDASADPMRVELYADIQRPFDEAQAGYQAFIGKITAAGYRIEENRFETQISKSQVVLKMTRTIP